VLKSVEVITASGNKCVFGRDELLFSYRCSPFQNGTLASATIIGASFELKPSLESREMQVSYLERYVGRYFFLVKSITVMRGDANILFGRVCWLVLLLS
jgi:UDP-N-acetylenolpyruvoylglucosamine reductase